MGCSTGLGCDSCEHDDPPPTPMEDVWLRLAQHGRTWQLGAADPGTAEDNQLGQVTWTFELPRGEIAVPVQILEDVVRLRREVRRQ